MRARLEPIAEAMDTITYDTYDNGKRFSGHQRVNKSISCKSYFAKPYRSWERGQNENANGLLRQYFPQSMKLTGYGKGYRLRGATITLCEDFDGAVTLLHKGKVLTYQTLQQGEPAVTIADDKTVLNQIEPVLHR